MDREMDMGSGISQGHFVKQTYHKKGDEVYQTKAHGAIGDGNRIVERQQMYENKSQGLQKAAHERMLNDKGRKVIKENVKGNVRNFDNYKNMTSADGPDFDHKWNEMANRMNFKSGFGNALEYGDTQYRAPPQPRRNDIMEERARAEARGLSAIPGGVENYQIG